MCFKYGNILIVPVYLLIDATHFPSGRSMLVSCCCIWRLDAGDTDGGSGLARFTPE